MSQEKITRYFDRILYSDYGDQNHLFCFQYKYMYSPFGKTIGAQGGMFNIGINLARFFSTKFILGGVADIKYIPGISVIKPSNEFLADFNSSYSPNFSTSLDSANSTVFYDNFNLNGIRGNNMFNFGFMFSPYPQKFGGIMFQVKTGITGFQFHQNIYGNPYVNYGGNDKVAMGVSKNWTYEITMKPLAFFKNTFYSKSSPNQLLLCSMVISFYYERLNFGSSTFNGTAMQEVVTSEFFEKYKIDHRFGFKIGLTFY